MDLKDATLVLLTESAEHPGLRQIAQAVYEEAVQGREVPHTVLSEMLGAASGQGVLRFLQHKYSPAAYDAILMPICQEIGRQAPVRPMRPH
jgi:hypothetical protein